MKKSATLVLGLMAALIATAKGILKNRAAQDQDEIDLAVVATKRRIRMRAQPFLGATILVAAGAAELDLRRVVPAPTGVEIAMMIFGGSLRVVIPPEWDVATAVSLRATALILPTSEAPSDRPVLRLEGSAWLSRLEVVQRSVPVAVAS